MAAAETESFEAYNSHFFDILPDGSVRCLYTDAIDLRAFGEVAVTRASSVEFNGATQMWEARMPAGDGPLGGQVIASHPSRAECLKREVAWLQFRM